MVFIETPIFTKKIGDQLTEDEYSDLQIELVKNPKKGARIPGTNGLRKLRWQVEGQRQGKRGGLRIIYYYLDKDNQIYMLYSYKKNEQEDLTKAQQKQLAAYVKRGVL